MKLESHWCDNPECADFGKADANTIAIHSYVERRYYCTSCGGTFSADKGTVFETLRSPREVIVNALAHLCERNSLRATGRLLQLRHGTILHWLALTGAHTKALEHHLIRELHLTQVQIDELWTFVKKTGPSHTSRSA